MQVLEDFDAGSRNCDGCRVACVYDIIFIQLPSSLQLISHRLLQTNLLQHCCHHIDLALRSVLGASSWTILTHVIFDKWCFPCLKERHSLGAGTSERPSGRCRLGCRNQDWHTVWLRQGKHLHTHPRCAEYRGEPQVHGLYTKKSLSRLLDPDWNFFLAGWFRCRARRRAQSFHGDRHRHDVRVDWTPGWPLCRRHLRRRRGVGIEEEGQ